MLHEHAAFLDELEKIAITRAAREAQKALKAGDVGTARDIAQAYKQLELSPRYLHDISTGGVEGAVDAIMGHRLGMDPESSGLIVRKMYKPDSWLAQGEHMGRALEQKKKFIDEMRALPSGESPVSAAFNRRLGRPRKPSPKEMTPAMYGYKQILGKGPDPLHVSYHEYVPGLEHMKGGDPRVRDVVNQVINPMARKGHVVADVAGADLFQQWHHPENLLATAGGTPKIVDIWPHDLGGSNPIKEWQAAHGINPMINRPENHPWTFAPSILGIKPNTTAEPEEAAMYMQGLRKHLFGKGGEPAFADEKVIAKRLLKQKKKRLGAEGLLAHPRAQELADIAGVSLHRPPGRLAKLLKGLKRTVRRHPVATGLAAAGTVAAGLGGAAYLKRRKKQKQEAEQALEAA